MAEFYRKKKKICQMCAGKSVDYKDVMIINKYINDKGKILPRRMTGACAKHQRHIAQQIKYARFMALIPLLNNLAHLWVSFSILKLLIVIKYL